MLNTFYGSHLKANSNITVQVKIIIPYVVGSCEDLINSEEINGTKLLSGKVKPYGAQGTAPKSSTWAPTFGDYGRSIGFCFGKDSTVTSNSSKIVRAVPKAETQQDVKSGVQKFWVKLLPESLGQNTMDVLCQPRKSLMGSNKVGQVSETQKEEIADNPKDVSSPPGQHKNVKSGGSAGLSSGHSVSSRPAKLKKVKSVKTALPSGGHSVSPRSAKVKKVKSVKTAPLSGGHSVSPRSGQHGIRLTAAGKTLDVRSKDSVSPRSEQHGIRRTTAGKTLAVRSEDPVPERQRSPKKGQKRAAPVPGSNDQLPHGNDDA
nr:protein free1 [Quercus suber]